MIALVVRWPCGCVRCVWPMPYGNWDALAFAERHWAADGCTWVDEEIDADDPPTGAGCRHRADVELTEGVAG